MPAVRLSRLEVWSDFECASGTRLGFYVPLPTSAVRDREINGVHTLTVQLHRDVDSWSLIEQGRVLRAHLSDGSYAEYRIAEIGQAHEQGSRLVAEVVAEAPEYDLGDDLVGHVLGDGRVLHDFPLPSLTPTEHLNVILGSTSGFVSPAAAGWWSVGTVDFSARVTINYQGFTAQEALHELLKVLSNAGTPAEVEVLRVGTSGYSLGLRQAIGASAETAYLRMGRNLHGVQEREVGEDAPTRIYPFGQDQDGVRFSIGDARWEVAAVSSNNVDLSGSPVAFDDQFNGLYLERPDGTKIQISDTVKASQRVVLASAPGLSQGDLVWIRKNAAGDELTYVDRPTSGRTRQGRIDRPDIPPVDNLVPNPFVNEWSGGAPVGWAAVGGASLTEVSTGAHILHGVRSAQIVSLSEEGGIETDWIAVTPKASSPHFLTQIAAFVVEGVWRLEVLAEDGSATQYTIPDDFTGQRAYTSVAGAWTERLLIQDQAVDFNGLGIVKVKLRFIADRLDGTTGQASCYFDAGQLVQTPVADLPFYGDFASRELWRAANEKLLAVDDGAFSLQVSITDLYRRDSTRFPHDQLVLGGNVQVDNPKLDMSTQVRIRRTREELMQEGATEVELSDRPEELVDVTRLPFGTRPGTLRPPGSGGEVDGDPILDEDDQVLYLEPRKKPGAASVKYLVSETSITENDVINSGTPSDTDGPIQVFTFDEDAQKRYVGVAYYPGPGASGKVGKVHILTPYTYYVQDNIPVIGWRVAPAPSKDQWRITLSITDDGDEVAGYHRSYEEGATPPAFTRNPASGYVSDPHAFSVDVSKPATEADPDYIFEAYAEDNASPVNESRRLYLRVQREMVEAFNKLKSVWMEQRVFTLNLPGTSGVPGDTVTVKGLDLYYQLETSRVQSIVVERWVDGVAETSRTVNTGGTDGRHNLIFGNPTAGLGPLVNIGSTYRIRATPYDGTDGTGNPGEPIEAEVAVTTDMMSVENADASVNMRTTKTVFGDSLVVSSRESDGAATVDLKISTGTGPPGTLAIGELYGRHD